jgi:nicotinamide-nucleotide amidase
MIDWEKELEPILENIKTILLEKKQTVAVAESVTAGQLQFMLSLAENAQQFFQGGITTYNLGQKSRHLLVEPIHAISCNCVSEKVAVEMARHVTSLFMSDWGIGITGYASPVPEKNIHQLFACYAFYFRGIKIAVHTVNVEKNAPVQVRWVYTQKVLHHFLNLLKTESFSVV